ncbi:hypothetical protein PRIPAC_79705 [Pristionchus pacificus]|uniref:Uncharacterized protein n=1 Tax=Pristionchus pacificus TaxID=54126 RepID=A0A2A6C1L2_PRIPA|nr:hypothetical protein PRIPAC_79705 [Pristionchus pacificus]|eukprot:PDM72142.1 hypothetical protein PRIPAC_38576 [Pristionchus pacificus]
MSYSYKCLLVHHIGDGVFHVQLNRPKQLNAINPEMWEEIEDVFRKLDTDSDCRVVIFSGNGRAFTAGIDLKSFSSNLTDLMAKDHDVARKGREILRLAEKMAVAFNLIEKCTKPVIAAIHGYCIVRELAVGFAADQGTLNRLPKIVGNHSWMHEIAMTARDFYGPEALQQGYVSRLFDTQEAMMAAAKETANAIATSSPVAVQGTKIVLNYARDHSVDESLRYVAIWNMSQLQTEDMAQSAVAVMTKGPKPIYAKL